MSCKILGGLALFLLIGAAIPLSIKTKTAATQPTTPSATTAATQPSATSDAAKPTTTPAPITISTPTTVFAPAAASVPTAVPFAAQPVKPAPAQPVVVVTAVPEKTTAPVQIPMSPGTGHDSAAQASAMPGSNVAAGASVNGGNASPQMSQWSPNGTTASTAGPNNATMGNGAMGNGATGNGASPVRQVEYQAEVPNTGVMSTPWRQ